MKNIQKIALILSCTLAHAVAIQGMENNNNNSGPQFYDVSAAVVNNSERELRLNCTSSPSITLQPGRKRAINMFYPRNRFQETFNPLYYPRITINHKDYTFIPTGNESSIVITIGQDETLTESIGHQGPRFRQVKFEAVNDTKIDLYPILCEPNRENDEAYINSVVTNPLLQPNVLEPGKKRIIVATCRPEFSKFDTLMFLKKNQNQYTKVLAATPNGGNLVEHLSLAALARQTSTDLNTQPECFDCVRVEVHNNQADAVQLFVLDLNGKPRDVAVSTPFVWLSKNKDTITLSANESIVMQTSTLNSTDFNPGKVFGVFKPTGKNKYEHIRICKKHNQYKVQYQRQAVDVKINNKSGHTLDVFICDKTAGDKNIPTLRLTDSADQNPRLLYIGEEAEYILTQDQVLVVQHAEPGDGLHLGKAHYTVEPDFCEASNEVSVEPKNIKGNISVRFDCISRDGSKENKKVTNRTIRVELHNHYSSAVQLFVLDSNGRPKNILPETPFLWLVKDEKFTITMNTDESIAAHMPTFDHPEFNPEEVQCKFEPNPDGSDAQSFIIGTTNKN